MDSDARTIDLVKRNVAHARMQGGRDCCDVMLPGANDLLANFCWGGFLGWGVFGWLWGRMETKEASVGPRLEPSFCFNELPFGEAFHWHKL